ncbi:MAG: S46 family peptidase [Planctomycetes bacterium]|nr:S46 family peptidase [Planctomycetota bacterium]
MWSRAAFLALFLLPATPALADEGMWTFHSPPKKLLKEKYGFELSDAWLEHVRLASVRFNSGGSGAFVSPKGLAITNHHVGLDSLHKLSTPAHDYVQDGFYARSQAEELKCQDLELNVLVAMTDVSERVKSAVAADATPEEAVKQRRAAIGAIEKEAFDASGLRTDVVTLYRGGEYWLYQYRQYKDVRLVFAPEGQIGFFGGDPDNFTYPRFNLDFSVFRVYEDDKPAATPHYLQFSPDGVAEGDLLFVSGNPGSTNRLQTLVQIEYLRDRSRPRALDTIAYLGAALREYAARGAEEERQTKDMLFGLENSRKAYTGELKGLLDEALMLRKAEEEAALREEVAKRPELAEEIGGAWDEIAEAQALIAEQDDRFYYGRLRSDLAGKALTIVRYVAEVEKPNGERLPEFRDSNLDNLKFSLFSEAPIYPGLDETMLRAGLELAAEHLPPDDPLLELLLGGKEPAALAHALIAGTKLGDPAARKQLVEGGAAAVAASEDPLIALARSVDPLLREMQQRAEELSFRITQGQEKIARARFAVFGNSVYPDATFTLRLAFGVAKGYEEDTTLVPWKTNFYGLFGRCRAFDNKPPFDLPPNYLERESRIDLSAPIDFVSTCDITGGNSGSPTINRKGELVGLIFDGNIQSLPNSFVFADAADRAVSVHVAGILESLVKVYDAGPLAAELLGGM